MAAFHFGSSKDKAAEIKAQEIKQSEGVDTLATGDFTGKKLRWYNEPYGIPGTRGIVPNTPRFKRMMKFQEEWSVRITCKVRFWVFFLTNQPRSWP